MLFFIKLFSKFLILIGIKKNSKLYNFFKYIYIFLKKTLNNFFNSIIKLRYFYSTYVIVKKYKNYNQYLKHQLEKTNDVFLRASWEKKENHKKRTDAFINFFKKNELIIKNSNKALAIGARMGNEVKAIEYYGTKCIGLDIVPYKNLVIKGDMHNLPFEDKTFDFIFTNILDHSIHPKKFFSEVKRVLKNDGFFLVHMLIDLDDDTYSVTNITNIGQMKRLAKDFSIINIIDTDKDSLSFFKFNKEFLFKKLN